jgi:hypothetical protein
MINTGIRVRVRVRANKVWVRVNIGYRINI